MRTKSVDCSNASVFASPQDNALMGNQKGFGLAGF
jgi:hypothetical protein